MPTAPHLTAQKLVAETTATALKVNTATLVMIDAESKGDVDNASPLSKIVKARLDIPVVATAHTARVHVHY